LSGTQPFDAPVHDKSRPFRQARQGIAEVQAPAPDPPSVAIVVELQGDARPQSQPARQARQVPGPPQQFQPRGPGLIRRLVHWVRKGTAQSDQVGLQAHPHGTRRTRFHRGHQYAAVPRELSVEPVQRTAAKQFLQRFRGRRTVQVQPIPVAGHSGGGPVHVDQQRLIEKPSLQLAHAHSGAGKANAAPQIGDRGYQVVQLHFSAAEFGLGENFPGAPVRDGQPELHAGSGRA